MLLDTIESLYEVRCGEDGCKKDHVMLLDTMESLYEVRCGEDGCVPTLDRLNGDGSEGTLRTEMAGCVVTEAPFLNGGGVTRVLDP